MRKRSFFIRPSIIWICVLVAFAMLSIVLKVTAFSDEELKARGAVTGFGFEKFGWVWIAVSVLLLLTEVKFITFSEDQIFVYNILGIRRKLLKGKIKLIQFVKKKDTYYMLIILKDHETFGGYKQEVLPFAWFSPIKVIHLVIPSKKWELYFDSVKNFYSNTSYLNCDTVSRTK